MKARVVIWLLLLGASPFAACECVPGPEVQAGDPVGTLAAKKVSGGYELVLGDLKGAVRALQVDVVIDGSVATGVSAIGRVKHDIVEAGLSEEKSSFTVVIADSRRLLLTEGALAKIAVSGEAPMILKNTVAVDDEGRPRTLVVP